MGSKQRPTPWDEDLSGHPDRADNERAMFSGFRSVREHYEIAPGGIVIGSGAHARWHAPIAHPELPQMVAKLETADDAGLVAFYETYGPLNLLSVSPDPEQHFYTWPDGRRTMGGDPVPWIRAHARTVRICLEVTEALLSNNASALGRVTTDTTRGYANRGAIEPASAPELIRTALLFRTDDRTTGQPNLATRARLLRATLINQNIARIHRFLTVKPDGTEQSYFAFAAQIEAVYWHLANVVEGGIVARCKRPGCGALFIQRHRSQEYCAPRYGQRESPCALWVRQRRLGHAGRLQRIATDSKTRGSKVPQVRVGTTTKARQSPRGAKRA